MRGLEDRQLHARRKEGALLSQEISILVRKDDVELIFRLSDILIRDWSRSVSFSA